MSDQQKAPVVPAPSISIDCPLHFDHLKKTFNVKGQLTLGSAGGTVACHVQNPPTGSQQHPLVPVSGSGPWVAKFTNVSDTPNGQFAMVIAVLRDSTGTVVATTGVQGLTISGSGKKDCP
jgi:hypothetical protein